jgi:hypothetical protein
MLFALSGGRRPTDAGPLRFLIYCASRWHGPLALCPSAKGWGWIELAVLLPKPSRRCAALCAVYAANQALPYPFSRMVRIVIAAGQQRRYTADGNASVRP